MLMYAIRLLRPTQWVKNIFVFTPLFFGSHIFVMSDLLSCIWIFLAFSFASSGIYCLNDIHDADYDRKHPKKALRPIASGKISKKVGYCLMSICWIVSYGILLLTGVPGKTGFASAIISLYIIMNLTYCIKLKYVSIVDLFTIALGFVLRVVIGSAVTDIELSHWIILMTFLLTLFIALAKRRDDVLTFESTGEKRRLIVDRYNLPFMNMSMCIVASVTIVCYLMYSVSDAVIERVGSKYLYTTSLFVIAGIIRFMQVTIVDHKSGSPTKVLYDDHFLQGCIFCWILEFAFLLYY